MALRITHSWDFKIIMIKLGSVKTFWNLLKISVKWIFLILNNKLSKQNNLTKEVIGK